MPGLVKVMEQIVFVIIAQVVEQGQQRKGWQNVDDDRTRSQIVWIVQNLHIYEDNYSKVD